MPWTCKQCAAEVTEDDLACPSCGQVKASWTMVPNQTRTMRVSSRKVRYLRGVVWETGEEDTGERVEAEQVYILTKARARELADAGSTPPSGHVVYARIHPGKKGISELDLTIEFEEQEPTTETYEPHRPYEELLTEAGYFDLPFAFVHGPGDSEGIAFEGIHVVDLTEGEGYAPSVELKVKSKPRRQLPVGPRAGTRFVEAGTLEPVAGCFIYLAPAPPEGQAEGGAPPPAEPEVIALTDPEGNAAAPPNGNDWPTGPAGAPLTLEEGKRYRLHWSYSPVQDLAGLPEHLWCEVTIAPQVELRPAFLHGTIEARLLELVPDDVQVEGDDEDDFLRPLANTAYTLQGPEDKPLRLEGTTDADGVLRHEDVPLVSYLLEAGGYVYLLDHLALEDDEEDPGPQDVILLAAPDQAEPVHDAAQLLITRGIEDDGDDEGPDEPAESDVVGAPDPDAEEVPDHEPDEYLASLDDWYEDASDMAQEDEEVVV
jgi:hypothetical protein